MDNASIEELVGIIICIIFSAFFSSTETAYSMVNRTKLKTIATDGNRRAKLAYSIVEDYDRFLSTILAGNNIANILSASLAAILFTRFFFDNGVTISTVVMTVVVLVFGEISPKSLAKENPMQIVLQSAPFLKFLMVLFTPLNFLFMQWKRILSHLFKHKESDVMTQEELMTIVDEAQNDGGIDEHNGELIRSAIEFNDLDAGDILTPRVDVVAIEKETPLDEITDLFMNHGFSRIPVYEESIDNIIGMIHEKDYFRGLHTGMTSIEGIIKSVIYIGSGIHISDLLRQLQQSKTHMAVVVDEFGGTEGIITMEDILEELVGDIWDEHDVVVEYFKKIGEKRYAVDCSADLDDFFKFFHFPLSAEDFDYVTVNGWVMEHLGKVPAIGDSFTYRENRITVTKTTSRHAVQVILQQPEKAEGGKKND